jgi:hypothetical protein
LRPARRRAFGCSRRSAAFGDREALWTKNLVTYLNDDPESPFGGWNHGEGINPRDVAKLLVSCLRGS